MDFHSRFGDQPLIEIMRRSRWTFSLLCGEVGVTYRHLYYVMGTSFRRPGFGTSYQPY
jgi:hypothetical protein